MNTDNYPCAYLQSRKHPGSKVEISANHSRCIMLIYTKKLTIRIDQTLSIPRILHTLQNFIATNIPPVLLLRRPLHIIHTLQPQRLAKAAGSRTSLAHVVGIGPTFARDGPGGAFFVGVAAWILIVGWEGGACAGVGGGALLTTT